MCFLRLFQKIAIAQYHRILRAFLLIIRVDTSCLTKYKAFWKDHCRYWNNEVLQNSNLNQNSEVIHYWNNEVLQNSRLDQDSQFFLREVGLPKQIGYSTFFGDSKVVGDSFFFGRFDAWPIGIDISSNYVFIMRDYPEPEKQFINSNIMLYSESLFIFQSLIANWDDGNRIDCSMRIEMIRNLLTTLDKRAFESEKLWWPEEVYGLYFV